MTELNAAARLTADAPQRLSRKDLFQRAAEKGYKIIDEGTRKKVIMNRNTGLMFYDDGTIHFLGMDLTAAKNIPLKDAYKILKLDK